MIKHVVMFKLKNFDEEERNNNLLKFKKDLEDLKEKIDVLKEMKVGINYADSPSAFDIVLISDFDTKEDLATYATHPEHLKVVEFVKQIVATRQVVDYEY